MKFILLELKNKSDFTTKTIQYVLSKPKRVELVDEAFNDYIENGDNEELKNILKNAGNVNDKDRKVVRQLQKFIEFIYRHDPTSTDKKIGKYAEWYINRFRKDPVKTLIKTSQITFDNLFQSFQLHEKFREHLDKEYRDINKIKDPLDLYRITTPYKDKMTKGDIQKRKQQGLKEVDVLYEDEYTLIIRPRTLWASKKWGGDCNWCVSGSRADTYFYNYTHCNSDNPLKEGEDYYDKCRYGLIIYIDKESGEKYLYSEKHGEFADCKNHHMPIDTLNQYLQRYCDNNEMEKAEYIVEEIYRGEFIKNKENLRGIFEVGNICDLIKKFVPSTDNEKWYEAVCNFWCTGSYDMIDNFMFDSIGNCLEYVGCSDLLSDIFTNDEIELYILKIAYYLKFKELPEENDKMVLFKKITGKDSYIDLEEELENYEDIYDSFKHRVCFEWCNYYYDSTYEDYAKAQMKNFMDFLRNTTEEGYTISFDVDFKKGRCKYTIKYEPKTQGCGFADESSDPFYSDSIFYMDEYIDWYGDESLATKNVKNFIKNILWLAIEDLKSE